MNVDNMRAVANLIELEDRFDYVMWTSGVDPENEESVESARHLDRCGTTGCVAGWAAYMALREGANDLEFRSIPQLARYYLGLDLWQSFRLFHELFDDDVSAVEVAKFMRAAADGEATL